MAYAESRPSWLTDADEPPHEVESVAGWSENYYSCAVDPSSGIGIYVHLSRRAGNPNPWEEVFGITLPGDEFLVAKAMASGNATGPSVGGISYRCDQPMVCWSKNYHGAARRISGTELRSGPLADGLNENVRMDLMFEAMTPPHDYGVAHVEQDWANGHYEQHGRMTGTLMIGGETVQFNGTGLRDHSWGPRDLTKVGDTSWLHGQFPESGRAFMLVDIPQPPHGEFTYACISDSKSVQAVRVTSPVPTATDAENGEQGGYTLVLESPEGEHVIHAEMVTALRMGFVGASEFCFGHQRGPGAHHDYIEAVTRFTWDGEVGYGFSERTVRV